MIKKTLYLIRGIPGSGKSTLARSLQADLRTDAWFEADMYFLKDGEYKFDHHKLPDAHHWCRNRVSAAMNRQVPDIIVSNTFTRRWEMEPYEILANQWGYTIQEIICNGRFKSIHNVPDNKVKAMEQGFEL